MTAYYNEIDPHAADWLRTLIAEKLIASGDVDTRSIADVQPGDLDGYTQCHFFAGIGVWSYALRQAGWPDSQPVWTGSCPCQPFSAAGKRKGKADERHLWPVWSALIRQRGPAVVLGEQVASPDGLDWFDTVHADLEEAGYAVGAADLCAAGFGAPHIRQRLFFVADTCGAPGERRAGSVSGTQATLDRARILDGRVADGPADGREAGDVAHTEHRGRGVGFAEWPGAGAALPPSATGVLGVAAGQGSQGGQDWRDAVHAQRPAAERAGGDAGELADAHYQSDRRSADSARGRGELVRGGPAGGLADASGRPVSDAWRGAEGRSGTGPVAGFWSDADWIFCRDDRWRPIEPGSFPLVDGAAFRVGSGSTYEGRSRAGMLKGYGNAIVAPVAAAFIRAYLDGRRLRVGVFA